MPGFQLLCPAAYVTESPKNPHAQKDLSVPRGVVVQDADRTPLARSFQLPQQVDGDIAGTDHEHRFSGEVDMAVQRALLPGAVRDPAARHDRGKQQRRKDKGRTRHVDIGAKERQQRGHRKGPDEAGERDALQVGQACVAPAAPV